MIVNCANKKHNGRVSSVSVGFRVREGQRFFSDSADLKDIARPSYMCLSKSFYLVVCHFKSPLTDFREGQHIFKTQRIL